MTLPTAEVGCWLGMVACDRFLTKLILLSFCIHQSTEMAKSEEDQPDLDFSCGRGPRTICLSRWREKKKQICDYNPRTLHIMNSIFSSTRLEKVFQQLVALDWNLPKRISWSPRVNTQQAAQ